MGGIGGADWRIEECEPPEGATLRMGGAGSGDPTNTVRLSPRVRSERLDNGAIASIPSCPGEAMLAAMVRAYAERMTPVDLQPVRG